MTEPHDWPLEQSAEGSLRPWYFRATGYLMVLFSDPEEAERAQRGLLERKVPPEELRLYESEDILRWVDARLEPEQRLFPEDGELCDEVVRLCRHFDDGLGPDARRLMYAHMLQRKHELLPINNQGVPAWEGHALSLLWPFAKAFANRELGIRPTTIRDDDPLVRSELDEVAELLSDGRRYLCGDRFTAADLTFAALAAAVIIPPGYGVPLAQAGELSGPIDAVVRSFREHPAGAFALELFRTDRHVRAGELAAAG